VILTLTSHAAGLVYRNRLRTVMGGANEGLRPSPHVIELIERDGQNIFQRKPEKPELVAINSVNRVAFYQLKSMLQGVVARGTARSIAALSPYVAGPWRSQSRRGGLCWFARSR
jgi:hypothetical protein